MKKRGLIFFALVALALGAGMSRAADEFPGKPIQLIVPYGAGGLTDIAARVVAEKMGKILGTNMLVMNKPGAGTRATRESSAAGGAPQGGARGERAAAVQAVMPPGSF